MLSEYTLSSLSRLLPDTSDAYLRGFLDDRYFQEKRDAERADEASLKPPAEVVAIAKRALRLTEEGKLKPGDGMESGTKQWVRKIANGESVSLDKARKGWRWFKRNSRFASEPQDSPAYAAWMYWFGSPGRAWFNRLAREYGFGDESGAEKEDYRGSGRRDSDRLDKRRSSSRSSGKGGSCGGNEHWVADPRTKGGGYCRKNPGGSLNASTQSRQRKTKRPSKAVRDLIIGVGIISAAAAVTAGGLAIADAMIDRAEKKYLKKQIDLTKRSIDANRSIATTGNSEHDKFINSILDKAEKDLAKAASPLDVSVIQAKMQTDLEIALRRRERKLNQEIKAEQQGLDQKRIERDIDKLFNDFDGFLKEISQDSNSIFGDFDEAELDSFIDDLDRLLNIFNTGQLPPDFKKKPPGSNADLNAKRKYIESIFNSTDSEELKRQRKRLEDIWNQSGDADRSDRMDRRRKGRSQSSGKGSSCGGNEHWVANAVVEGGGYCRKNPGSKAGASSSADKASGESKGPSLGVMAIAAGALVTGLPVASYTKSKHDYRKGFDESAEMIDEMADAVESQLKVEASKRTGKPIEELTAEEIFQVHRYPQGSDKQRAFVVDPKKEGITFTIGGFNDYGEDGTGIAVTLQRTLKNDSIIPLTNKKVQITAEDTYMPMNDLLDATLDPDGKGGTVERGFIARRPLGKAMQKVIGKEKLEAFRKTKSYQSLEPVARTALRSVRDVGMLTRNALENGYHADARDAAAYVVAFNRAFPDKPVRIVAHSGGGIVAAEALEILNRRNIKVKAANIGTPYFGLTNLKSDQLVTIAGKDDYMMQALPAQNKITIDDVTDHFWVGHAGSQGYGRSKQMKQQLQNFFYGKTDSAYRQDARGSCGGNEHWVADPRVKGGGYCRTNQGSSKPSNSSGEGIANALSSIAGKKANPKKAQKYLKHYRKQRQIRKEEREGKRKKKELTTLEKIDRAVTYTGIAVGAAMVIASTASLYADIDAVRQEVKDDIKANMNDLANLSKQVAQQDRNFGKFAKKFSGAANGAVTALANTDPIMATRASGQEAQLFNHYRSLLKAIDEVKDSNIVVGREGQKYFDRMFKPKYVEQLKQEVSQVANIYDVQAERVFDAYLEGRDRMDRRRQGRSQSSGQGGSCGGNEHWVADPRVKGGGYCRKSPGGKVGLGGSPFMKEEKGGGVGKFLKDFAVGAAIIVGVNILVAGVDAAASAVSRKVAEKNRLKNSRRYANEAFDKIFDQYKGRNHRYTPLVDVAIKEAREKVDKASSPEEIMEIFEAFESNLIDLHRASGNMDSVRMDSRDSSFDLIGEAQKIVRIELRELERVSNKSAEELYKQAGGRKIFKGNTEAANLFEETIRQLKGNRRDRMDRRRGAGRNAPAGYHWVDDPRVEGGGYLRRNPSHEGRLRAAASPADQGQRRAATGSGRVKVAAAVGLAALAGGIVGAGLVKFQNEKQIGQIIRDARQEAEAQSRYEMKKFMEAEEQKFKKARKAAESTALAKAEEALRPKVRAELEAESQAELQRQTQLVEERALIYAEQRAQDLSREKVARSEAEFKIQLEKRADQIRAEIHSEAQKQVVAERMKAQAAAREEILQKTAPPGRKGTVLADERQGIALGASIQQGLDFQHLPENRQKGRIRDAVDRLANRRAADGLRDLHMDFNREIRDFIRQPTSSGERMSQKRTAEVIMSRWGQLSDMLSRQAARETAYTGKVNQVKSAVKNEYMQLWEQLRELGYSETAVAEFDRKSAALSKKLLKSISEAVDSTRNENPLKD